MSQDCGCSVQFRTPKPNGTCATCGGWLPGERATLPWLETLINAPDVVELESPSHNTWSPFGV